MTYSMIIQIDLIAKTCINLDFQFSQLFIGLETMEGSNPLKHIGPIYERNFFLKMKSLNAFKLVY